MEVKIGCCGFPVARSRYFEKFEVVEIQRTFYRIPQIRTVDRWREEAPPDFEYTLKTWAAITHRPGGAVWRKAKIECGDCGMLRPTEGNFRAWEAIREVALRLNAKVVVFQSPPSFRRTDSTENDLISFFSSIDRKGLKVGWEPRNPSWWADGAWLARLLRELDLVHIVDLFYQRPVDESDLAYLRLHGRRKNGRIIYRHSYSTQELQRLASEIKKLGKETAYVMFNNTDMWVNALEFKEIAADLAHEM